MTFRKKLIALRHAKGVSQQQLGEALKVAPETVNSWELGLSTPDLDQLAKLADYFSLPLDILIKSAGHHQFDAPVMHMSDVQSHAVDPSRHRVITQMEILSGALAAICILGTVVYLIAGIF